MKLGVKRPSTEEPVEAPGTKRARVADLPHVTAVWKEFVPAEHASGLTRYAISLLSSIRERERVKVQLELIPGAIDHILDAVCFFVGEVWQLCVELSRIRIDVAVHELWRDEIEEDLDPMYFLESLNAYDEQERAKMLSGTSHDISLKNAQEGSSDVNASGFGKKKKRKPPNADSSEIIIPSGIEGGATNTSPSMSSSVPPTSGALLFGSTQAGPQSTNAATPEEKAREASLVQRKQAELSRQVNVDDLRAALALSASDEYLIKCPPRVRRTFAHLSCMYYEPFMERIAAMRAQGLSSANYAAVAGNHPPPLVGSSHRPMTLPQHLHPRR